MNTRNVNATGVASVTVTGAAPHAAVVLQGYSQNHAGTANFDNDKTPHDRLGMADANGAITFNDLRPAANTRLRAKTIGCDFGTQSSVINVRAQATLTTTRVGPRTYRFDGKSIPSRTGGLIVSIYRITGQPCQAGLEPRNCRDQILVDQIRANARTGEYAVSVRFPRADEYTRGRFLVQTGRDAQNAPGRSNLRSLLIL